VFSLTVPALRRTLAPAPAGDKRPLTAAITLTDAHAAGLAHAMLRGMRIGIADHKPELGPPEADLWVAQSPAPGAVTNYLAGSRSRRVVLVGEELATSADGDRIFHLNPSVPPSMFRATLARAARGDSTGSE